MPEEKYNKLLGSDIFVSGGYLQEAVNISKYTKSILSYDTKCNLWQDGGELNNARGWHQMVSHNSHAYIIGGCYQVTLIENFVKNSFKNSYKTQ